MSRPHAVHLPSVLALAEHCHHMFRALGAIENFDELACVTVDSSVTD